MHKFLDEIVEIEELPFEVSEMYDVGMVDTPHTFFANNILVHNSCYLDARPLIENFDDLDDIQKTIETQRISNEVTEFVNKAIVWLSEHCFHSKNNRLKFAQEKISKRAFWGQAKKRYAQLQVYIDPATNTLMEKTDIKGFDLVKSSFPTEFRIKMKELVVDILHDFDADQLNKKVRLFKKDYNDKSVFNIMLPTSVKEISKFKPNQKGTPIHVKSAQNYNKLLNVFEVYTIPPISDGDKILYAYMKQNPFNFETMALKGQDEDPPEIVEFVERFIDRERVFETTFISKLETIWEDLGWGKVQTVEPTNFF